MSELNLETQVSAVNSLEILDNALENLVDRRSAIGASLTRLDSALVTGQLKEESLRSFLEVSARKSVEELASALRQVPFQIGRVRRLERVQQDLLELKMQKSN